MPHYIWQSNLFLIISVEPRKESAISPSSPQSPRRPEGKFHILSVLNYFVPFPFHLVKFQLRCVFKMVGLPQVFSKVKSDVALMLEVPKWFLKTFIFSTKSRKAVH